MANMDPIGSPDGCCTVYSAQGIYGIIATAGKATRVEEGVVVVATVGTVVGAPVIQVFHI